MDRSIAACGSKSNLNNILLKDQQQVRPEKTERSKQCSRSKVESNSNKQQAATQTTNRIGAFEIQRETRQLFERRRRQFLFWRSSGVFLVLFFCVEGHVE